MPKHTVFFNRAESKFQGFSPEILKQLSESYPHLNIAEELAKMSLWLNSPKGIRRKGHIGFILNWLNQASKDVPTQIDWFDKDSLLMPLLNEYRRSLWKNCKNLLEFNKIRP